jgi:hypothetical protein
MSETPKPQFESGQPNIEVAYKRHSQLVDKKYLSGLTSEEEQELVLLGEIIDKDMEPYDLARLEMYKKKLGAEDGSKDEK